MPQNDRFIFPAKNAVGKMDAAGVDKTIIKSEKTDPMSARWLCLFEENRIKY